MKTYLLARVSSKEQEDNNSIPAQTRRLKEYAERTNLQVVEIYQLVESSTKANRQKFIEIIEVIRSSDEVVALVVETIDRLQRDFRESVALDELRRAGKVELHFVREGLRINQNSNSSEILRWDMGVMFAKSYVTQLSDNVKRSLEQKRQNGEWSGLAPYGYKNVDLPDGKKWLEIVPLEADSVRRAFEWYGTGNYSLRLIKQKLQAEHGRRFSTSQLDVLLKRRFYMGEMVINGKTYPHRYKRIIDPELFAQAKAVREGYKINPKRWGGLPYPYRGLIDCAVCGSRVTFEKKKGKYIYGHCTMFKQKHKAKYIPEAEITSQLTKVFKSIQIPETAYLEVSEKFRESYEQDKQDKESKAQVMDTEISKYQTRISRLHDLYIDDDISKEIYQRKVKEMEDSRKALERRRENIELDLDNNFGTVNHLLRLSKNAPKLFEKADIEQKRTLINLVLSNLSLDDEKLRWEYKKPFDKMAFCNENGNWLGRRDSNPRMPGPKPGALPLGHSPSLRYQHTESNHTNKVRAKRFTDKK